ncbi:DUF982 domain-containing protein [Rhizobium sp. OAE497]|jgi:hypothetical protein|uniref:DUF982 domain-containing protein n=1 Tax=Rhizobium sp. OAE497 TaxID=2663796 RepID=UPI0018F472A8
MPLLDVRWDRPVRIRLQCGLEHTFTSIYDALDFLEYEWPTRHGQRYDQAVKRCRRALSGVIPAAIAREGFVAACLEAGLPLIPTSRPEAPVEVQIPWEVMHHR